MNVVLKQPKTTLIKIMEEMFSSIEGETFEVNTKSGSVVFNEELGKLKECADWTQPLEAIPEAPRASGCTRL